MSEPTEHRQYAPSPSSTASSVLGSPNARSGSRTKGLISTTDTTLKVISGPSGLRSLRSDGDRPEALQAKIGTLSLEGQALLEKDTAKKEARAEAKALAEAKKKEVRLLQISRLLCES